MMGTMTMNKFVLVVVTVLVIISLVQFYDSAHDFLEEESYLLNQFSTLHFNDSSQVAICLMVRDDTDLVEWITYHNRIGVNKFYVYDNLSKPPLRPLVQPFIDINLVVYEYSYGETMPLYKQLVNRYIIEWRDPNINKQNFINDKCFADHSHKHKWMGFLDTDEFVRFLPIENFPASSINSKSFPAVLDRAEAEGCAGLAHPWTVFGSSGYVARPKGGVLGHYSKCHKGNMWKTFGYTKHMTGRTYIHNVEYKEGHDYCDAKETRIDHFAIKSWEDYQKKMKRGSGNAVKRSKDYFDGFDASSNITCEILRMPPRGDDTV